MIVDELDLEKVLFCGHTGVVVKVVEEACKKCPSKQATILNGLSMLSHNQKIVLHCSYHWSPEKCTLNLIVTKMMNSYH